MRTRPSPLPQAYRTYNSPVPAATPSPSTAAAAVREQKQLSQLFHDRAVTKTYLAVCAGNPGHAAVDVPIGRHPTNRQKMVAVENFAPGVRARRAVSHVRTAAFDGSLGVAEVRIETGRTHQIRVHMQVRDGHFMIERQRERGAERRRR
jgi:23S rRNA-/tRNA-specific pseudouridylate synthase